MGLPEVEAKIDTLIEKMDALIAKDSLFVKCPYCVNGETPRSVDHGEGVYGLEVEMATCTFCNGQKIIKFGEVL